MAQLRPELTYNGRFDRFARSVDRWHRKNGDEAGILVSLAVRMAPSEATVGLGMPGYREDLNDTVPNDGSPEFLTDRNRLDMNGLKPMELEDRFSEFVDTVHAVSLTKSATVQKSFSTPAAIAGVQRRVL